MALQELTQTFPFKTQVTDGIPPFLSKLCHQAEGNARLLKANTYAKRAKDKMMF